MNSTQNPNTPVQILTRDERITRFGLDCSSTGLEWRSWEPGGEFVKNLVIKNVATQTQKIKYKLPQSKFFGMSFPETITLSTGMSCTIKVIFRPIELNRYDDVIAFSCNSGSFYVPIRASLPAVGVVFTPKDCTLDFGIESVGESHVQKLTILNSGEVPFNFILGMPNTDMPFKISPAQGTLRPQESTVLTATFTPREAASYVTTSICSISGIQRTITLRGIAKYAFITADTSSLSFGDTLVGRNAERTITVRNTSQVRTTVRVCRVESDCDAAFAFATSSASIAPGESFPFKVTYSAATSGLYSSDTYEVSTPGGNTVTVRCVGNAIGPNLSPSITSFNFGSTSVGTTAKRVLTLTNTSDTPAYFQFFTSDSSDGGGDPTFLIEPRNGTVAARGNLMVSLVFTPQTPMAFYKRVMCLVRAGIPIWLDLVATAFDEQSRPAPLAQRHVDRFHARRIRANGLTTYPPETIEGIPLDDEEKKKDEEMEVGDEMAREITTVDPCEVFFYQNTHFTNAEFDDSSKVGLGLFGVKEVEVLESFVDFGSCPKFPSSRTANVPKIEPKIIRVANRTNGKLTCVWSVSKSQEQSVFRVEPPSDDIPPHSVQIFRVHFQPRAANQFYGTRLECFAYYKTMRNFRLVVEKSITPPWCFFTTVAGHTYEQGGETFLPRLELATRKIGFTSCHVGGATYQIISVTNIGDTSLSYRFEFQTGSVFACHPSRGVLRQEQTHLIVFRFRPTSVMTYRQAARCVLNNSPSNTIPIGLVGTASVASISFPDLVESTYEPVDVDTGISSNGNGAEEQDPLAVSGSRSLAPSPLSVTSPLPSTPSPPPIRKSDTNSIISTTKQPPNQFHFRLTCIGTVARRQCVVKNSARIPIVFRVSIPEKYREVLLIEPEEGELLGNETMAVQCSFAPTRAKTYTIQVSFSVAANSASSTTGEIRALQLLVVGEGVLGSLELDSQRIDFGNVLIGAATRREITVRNTTPCDVQYSLEWRLPNGQPPESAPTFGFSEVWDTDADYAEGEDVSEDDDATEDYMAGSDDGTKLQDHTISMSKARRQRSPLLEIVPSVGSIPAYSSTSASVIIRPRSQALLAYKLVS